MSKQQFEIETGTMLSGALPVQQLPSPGSSPISPGFSVPSTVDASDIEHPQPLDSGDALPNAAIAKAASKEEG